MVVSITWSVGGTDYEDVLFRPHTVHFGENLIDHSVSGAPGVPHITTSGFGDGVQLVKE